MQGWVSSVKQYEQQDTTFVSGVNTSVSPSDMQQGQLCKAENVDSFFAPTIATKRGVDTTLTTSMGRVEAFVSYGSFVYAGALDGVYRVASGGDGRSLSLINPPTKIFSVTSTALSDWSFAPYQQKNILLFVYDDLNSNPVLRKYDGSAVTAIASAPTGMRFVTTYANRIVLYGSRDTDKRNSIYLSGLADENDWTSTDLYVGSVILKLPESDGSSITAVYRYAGQLLIFTATQTFALYGQDATNFQIVKLFDVGCVGNDAIKEVDGVLYWVAIEGIYRYSGGFPSVISDVLRPTLFPVSATNAFGFYTKLDTDGRFLYVSLGSTVPVYYRAIKYDLDVGSWWQTTDIPTALIYINNGLLTSDASGTLTVMNKATNPAATVPFDVVTGPVFYKNERTTGAIHRLKVVIEVESGASVNISYSIGEQSENWIVARTLANQTGEVMLVDVPILVSSPSPWFRLRFNGTGDVRIHRVTTSYTARGR